MMAASDTVAAALALLASHDPDALRLARFASLAARIEPELLRALRLELLPGAPASTEADVWFSEAVHVRGATAITFDSEAAARLRADVLQEGPPRVARAFRIVQRVHAAGPELLRLEEKLVLVSLRGRTRTLEAIVGRVLRTMLDDPARGADLAAWAQRALPRLPAPARESEAYWALLFAANAQLPGSAIEPVALPASVVAPVPAIFAGRSDVRVAVERLGNAVRMRIAEPSDRNTVPAPDLRPIVVAVSSAEGAPVVRIVEARRWCADIPVSGSTVRLRVADGRQHVATVASAPAPNSAAEPVFDPAASLARIVGDDGKWQNGYLVAPQLIATALLEGPGHERRVLVGGLSHKAWTVYESTTDIAILKLDAPVEKPKPLALDEHSERFPITSPWTVWAYTASEEAPSALQESQPHEALVSHLDSSFLHPELVRRLPGAPILSENRVVAHVGGHDERGLRVVPARTVAEALARVRNEPSISAPEEPETMQEFLENWTLSIYSALADALVERVALAPDARITQLAGGTGLGRGHLARYFARRTGDKAFPRWIFVRRFSRGDAFPEDIAKKFDGRGIVVLDGVDRLNEDGRRRMRELLAYAAENPLGHWLVTAERPLPEVSGPFARTIDAGNLPRDRDMLRALHALDPEDPDLAARTAKALRAGESTILAAIAAVEAVDPKAQTVRKARAWLQCPCRHHLDELPTDRRMSRGVFADELARLVHAEAEDYVAPDIRKRVFEVCFEQGRPGRVLDAIRFAILGGDSVRYVEANEVGRVSLWLQLELARHERDASIEDLRELSRDPGLELFPSTELTETDVASRLLLETTRDGYRRLATAHRSGELESVLGVPIRWLAEPNPSPDIEDPNRGRFGGLPERPGGLVTASVTHETELEFRVDIEVLTDLDPLRREIPDIEVFGPDGQPLAVDRNTTTLRMTLRTWRTFTVGVKFEDTRLELDLANLRGCPEEFVRPGHAISSIPLEPGTTWRYEDAYSTAGATPSNQTEMMTIVASHMIETARPIIVALVRGGASFKQQDSIVIRYGSLYFQTRGGEQELDRFLESPEALRSIVEDDANLWFRIPIASGALLARSGQDSPWICESVESGNNGLNAYNFKHQQRGAEFTVVAGTGLTSYSDMGENYSRRQLTLTELRIGGRVPSPEPVTGETSDGRTYEVHARTARAARTNFAPRASIGELRRRDNDSPVGVAYLVRPDLAVTAGRYTPWQTRIPVDIYRLGETCALDIAGADREAEVISIDERGEIVYLRVSPAVDEGTAPLPLAPALIRGEPVTVRSGSGEAVDGIFTSHDSIRLQRPSALRPPYLGAPIMQDDLVLAHVVAHDEGTVHFCPAFLVGMYVHRAARLAAAIDLTGRFGVVSAEELRISVAALKLEAAEVEQLWASRYEKRRWIALVAITEGKLAACMPIVQEGLQSDSLEERLEAAAAIDVLTGTPPERSRADIELLARPVDAGPGLFGDEAVAALNDLIVKRSGPRVDVYGGSYLARLALMWRWIELEHRDPPVFACTLTAAWSPQDLLSRLRAIARAADLTIESDLPMAVRRIAEASGLVLVDCGGVAVEAENDLIAVLTETFRQTPGNLVVVAETPRGGSATEIDIDRLPRRSELHDSLAAGWELTKHGSEVLLLAAEAAVQAARDALAFDEAKVVSAAVARLDAIAHRRRRTPYAHEDDASLAVRDVNRARPRSTSGMRTLEAYRSFSRALNGDLEETTRAIGQAISVVKEPAILRAMRRALLGPFIEDVFWLRRNGSAEGRWMFPSDRWHLKRPPLDPTLWITRGPASESDRFLELWRAGDLAPAGARILWLARHAPEPDPDDPHRGAFNCVPECNGRRASARVVERLPTGLFRVLLTVESVTPKPLLYGELVFHLHPDFDEPIVREPARPHRVQIELLCDKAFAIGIVLDEGLTHLELDLTLVRDAPREFFEKPSGRRRGRLVSRPHAEKVREHLDAVVRISQEQSSWCGLLVAPELVATVAHGRGVLADNITIETRSQETRRARVLMLNDDLDIAILRLDRAVDGFAPLPLPFRDPHMAYDTSIEIMSWPAGAPEAVLESGRVSDIEARALVISPALPVSFSEVASGAPVWGEGAVIGLVRARRTETIEAIPGAFVARMLRQIAEGKIE